MIPYFGASVYDDPAVYAKSSAINFIKQANTPTLVVVGDRDGECPAPQSFEFWHACAMNMCRPSSSSIPTKATASSIPSIAATCWIAPSTGLRSTCRRPKPLILRFPPSVISVYTGMRRLNRGALLIHLKCGVWSREFRVFYDPISPPGAHS